MYGVIRKSCRKATQSLTVGKLLKQVKLQILVTFLRKCVDALWKRDEETSVAEILKLSGECA